MSDTQQQQNDEQTPPDWKTAWHLTFIEHLSQMGNYTRAAKAAGISLKTFYNHRNKYPEFAEAVKWALRSAHDELEAEAYRRAYVGVQKPVFQGGQQVGTITEYSDPLLIQLLKGARPSKFRERVEVGGNKKRPIQHRVTLDFSKFSDDELIKFERAFVRSSGGDSSQSRN